MWASNILVVAVACIGALESTFIFESPKFRAASSTLSCKDNKGKDVEWFVIYKLAKSSADSEIANSIDTDGSTMAYIDSNNKNGKWLSLDKTITEEGQPISDTLAPLYSGSKPTDLMYAVYSDQVPDPYTGTTAGHTKGVLMADSEQAVWLTHSVPRFPANLFDTYQYPDSGLNNGQVLMCITTKYDQLPTIVEHLKTQFPKVYEGNVPDSMAEEFPDLVNMVNGKNARKCEKLVTDDITGVKGTVFTSFAKHHSYDVDIYSNVLAPKLDVDLLAETWRNGVGTKLPPTCPSSGVTVQNMANVVVSFSNTKDVVAFGTTSDHAKWAISDDTTQPWFCASSLNRMQSQYKRGGETLCIKSKPVYQAFVSTVDKCDMCSRRPSQICKTQQEV